MPDKTQAYTIAAALATAIRDLGSVPSGHLYARVMHNLSLEVYESLIDTLIRVKLVSRKNHVLTWIGPKES